MASAYNTPDGCPSCIQKASYSDLSGTTNYNCDQACLCRFSTERSDKDRMMFDFYVLGQPWPWSNRNGFQKGQIRDGSRESMPMYMRENYCVSGCTMRKPSMPVGLPRR
jgi:hypothetical protein